MWTFAGYDDRDFFPVHGDSPGRSRQPAGPASIATPVREAMMRHQQRLHDPQAGGAGGAGGFGAPWRAASFGSLGGSEEDSEALAVEENILVNLHGNVYSSAFAFTVRSMCEGRKGSLVMAWIWAAFASFVEGFFIYVTYAYAAYRLELSYFNDVDDISAARHNLISAIETNISLSGQAYERRIINMCHNLPSPLFFCAVEFIFCCFCMSNLSEIRTLFCQIWLCPTVMSRQQTMEEHESSALIVGLLPKDYWVFIVGLVIPKTVLTIVLWYIGTASVAFTREMHHMIFRAIVLIIISHLDSVLFHSFVSSSKKEWLVRSQVLMARTQCLRYGTAWPGELAKLAAVLWFVWLSYVLFEDEFSLRTLCWDCARDCSRRCSESFPACREGVPHFWPWLHEVH